MLPLALSAVACSLAPGVERLAVTAEIVARRRRRGALGELLSQPDPLRPPPRLRRARSHLRRRRARRRRDRGAARARPPRSRRRCASGAPAAALEISTTEPEFEFDADGHVVAAHAVAQTEAHGLIEQLMILTNERVAELCERRGVPTLYRVHERPDPQRIAVLFEQLAALDVPTPPLPDPRR